MSGAVVIGVGNPSRGDDGLGLEVARVLRGRIPAGARVVTCRSDATSLLAAWEGADLAIVVDAIHGAEAGEVQRIDATHEPVPRGMACSSHTLGVADAIELARTLGALPPRVLVYGVGAVSFGVGQPLSDEVAEAIAPLLDRILDELPLHTSCL